MTNLKPNLTSNLTTTKLTTSEPTTAYFTTIHHNIKPLSAWQTSLSRGAVSPQSPPGKLGTQSRPGFSVGSLKASSAAHTHKHTNAQKKKKSSFAKTKAVKHTHLSKYGRAGERVLRHTHKL
jgi:hypothetical protein